MIDWSNASRGVADVDVALTWVLIAAGEGTEAPLGRLKAACWNEVGRCFSTASWGEPTSLRRDTTLRDIVEWKAQDPNMTDGERGRMREVAATHTPA